MLALSNVNRPFRPSTINAVCIKFRVVFGDETRRSFCTSLMAAVIGPQVGRRKVSNAAVGGMLFDVSGYGG